MPSEETKAEIAIAVEKEVAKQEGTSTQKPGLFVSFKHINWTRFAGLVTAMIGIWSTMGWLVPAKHFAIVAGLLGTLSMTLGYITRSSTWVSERKDPPSGGQP